MTEAVQQTEVDGVPAFWAPLPGAFRAALMFRVGTADETPSAACSPGLRPAS